jgi:hypothetical protein
MGRLPQHACRIDFTDFRLPEPLAPLRTLPEAPLPPPSYPNPPVPRLSLQRPPEALPWLPYRHGHGQGHPSPASPRASPPTPPSRPALGTRSIDRTAPLPAWVVRATLVRMGTRRRASRSVHGRGRWTLRRGWVHFRQRAGGCRCRSSLAGGGGDLAWAKGSGDRGAFSGVG